MTIQLKEFLQRAVDFFKTDEIIICDGITILHGGDISFTSTTINSPIVVHVHDEHTINPVGILHDSIRSFIQSWQEFYKFDNFDIKHVRVGSVTDSNGVSTVKYICIMSGHDKVQVAWGLFHYPIQMHDYAWV